MNVRLVNMSETDGRVAKEELRRINTFRVQRGEIVEVVATPKPQQDPILTQELTPPGQPPVPPEPVPDCRRWRYFVEKWELTSTEDKSYSKPVITGIDRIPYNFGGFVTYIEVPRIVNIPVISMLFHYEWVAMEYNGCGVLLSTHRSGVKTSSAVSYTDHALANALLANDAQVRQLQAWNASLVERANAAGRDAYAASASTAGIMTGVYQTSEEGFHRTQSMIESMMRDYAEKVNVYNSALEQHQMSVEQYERQVEAKAQAEALYDEQVEITSNMIREDKVGTAYTVKGAGNKTISLTVGQEIQGSQLISSGIQSIGSGYNIDPQATYIITDVVLTHTAPRVNVPGLWGTSFPGKIVITK